MTITLTRYKKQVQDVKEGSFTACACSVFHKVFVKINHSVGLHFVMSQRLLTSAMKNSHDNDRNI